MEYITNSLVGGVLIGLAATLMLLLNGRIAGISGILGGVLSPRQGGLHWRLAFVLGLVIAGFAYPLFSSEALAFQLDAPVWAIVTGGFLVGFGTRLGSGCTSGHGVCGIARFSWRSISATLIFMLTAIATVAIVRNLAGAI